jgi:ribosomal protein L29
MPTLTANDLKTRGVAAIETLLASQPEAMISVRGTDRFVVMELAHYNYLRECELEAALAQTRADLAAGRVKHDSPAEHVKRVMAPAKTLAKRGGAARAAGAVAARRK